MSGWPTSRPIHAGVAEQADALVLETSIERCVSSSLTISTIGVLPPLVKLRK